MQELYNNTVWRAIRIVLPAKEAFFFFLSLVLFSSFNTMGQSVTEPTQSSSLCLPVLPHNPTGKIPAGMVYINSTDGTLRYFDGKQFVACVQTFFTPWVSDISIKGTALIGKVIEVEYRWGSATEKEGTSVVQWYSASDANGSNKKAINGATNKTYKVLLPVGSFIAVGITPENANGNRGVETFSKWVIVDSK